MRGPGRRQLVVALGASLTMLAAAACSSGTADDDGGGGGGSGSGLPDTIPVTLVADMTGPLAFYGTQLEAGVQAGLEYVNESDLLGGSQIELTVLDTASTVPQATTRVSEAVQSDAVAILGPSLSQEALATAPIAQQAGVPYLAETSPPGMTDVGEYVFSMTTPQDSMTDTLVTEVAKENESVTLIFASDSPTIAALGEQTRDAFEAEGVEVAEFIETSLTATDFTAAGTRAIQSEAQAIGILGGGPMMPSILTTLRDQGFEGLVFGNAGSDGTIATAEEDANGYRYVTEWAPDLPGEINEDFQSRFEALYPDLTPYYPAVDGYTEMLFLALALQAADSADRDALLEGMNQVAEEGFDGPAGRVEFEGRQLIGPTIYVEFQDGATSQVTE